MTRQRIGDWVVDISETEDGDLQVTALRSTKPGLVAPREVRCSDPRMISLILQSV